MSLVSQTGIQTPEYLYDTKRCLGYRLGDITTGRGYCTDNGKSTFSSFGTVGDNTTCTLVELCKTATEVCRITFFTGHFLKTTGHLTKCLCPTGGGVCHQRYGVTHITEILCDGNTYVNRCLTSSNRHVGGVRDEHGTLHQGVSGLRVLQFRELVQYVGHLVTTLAAADVNYDVCLCPLSKLMLYDSLAASERTRNSCNTTLCNREQCIDNTLTGYKRHIRR